MPCCELELSNATHAAHWGDTAGIIRRVDLRFRSRSDFDIDKITIDGWLELLSGERVNDEELTSVNLSRPMRGVLSA
jgi:hypothetical protein